MAAYKGSFDVFMTLFGSAANIDDVDEDSKTVIHLVAEQNYAHMLQVRIVFCVNHTSQVCTVNIYV